MVRSIIGAAALAVLASGSVAHGQMLASANFASYADGALVGQNGWVQFNTQGTNPLQVSGGRVTWAGNGNAVTNHQDAMLSFGQVIGQPSEGTTVLHFDMLLSISSAGTSPSYFAALNSFDTTVVSNNFANVRMVARSEGSGFVFGTRVNGQGGYPFGYGSTVLDFGTTYALRAEINLVAGNANDFIRLYVGDSFSTMSLHATAAYGSGTVSDISVGAMVLSQFSSGTAFESGVSVQSMSVYVVPAPGALALLGVAGIVSRRRRR